MLFDGGGERGKGNFLLGKLLHRMRGRGEKGKERKRKKEEGKEREGK